MNRFISPIPMRRIIAPKRSTSPQTSLSSLPMPTGSSKFDELPENKIFDSINSSVKSHSAAKRPTKLLTVLKTMREQEEKTDVILVCKGQELKAHSLILSAGSAYLKKMLANEQEGITETRIELPDIDETTMTVVLDFMYLSSDEVIMNQGFDNLIQILQAASKLLIEDLLDCVWEQILRLLTVGNCLDVWNAIMDKTEEHQKDTLNFVLKNLNEIFAKEIHLNFQIPHIRMIVEQLYKEKVPCEDFIFQGIIKWAKNDPKRKEYIKSVLLILDYKLISMPFIDQLLTDEELVGKDDFVKDFLMFQKTSKVMPENDCDETLLKTFPSFQISNANISVYTFIIGYHYESSSDVFYTKKYSVQLFDVFGKDTKMKEIPLPLVLRDIVQCFHDNNSLYFLTQDSPISDIQYLLSFNCYTSTKILDTFLPEPVVFAGGCATTDRIYIIGIPIKTELIKTLKIHYYILSQKRWCSQFIQNPDEVITCIMMNDNLHILFKSAEHQTHYFVVVSPYNDTPYVNRNIRLEYNLVKELITVYKNELYCFIPGKNSYICLVYKPHEDNWYTFIVPFKHDEPMKKCFTVEHQGIYFYSVWGNLFKVGGPHRSIVRVDGNIPYLSLEGGKFFTDNITNCNDVFCTFH